MTINPLVAKIYSGHDFGLLWPFLWLDGKKTKPLHIYVQKGFHLTFESWHHNNRVPSHLNMICGRCVAFCGLFWCPLFCSEGKTTTPIHIYGQRVFLRLMELAQRPTSLCDTFWICLVDLQGSLWAPCYGQHDQVNTHLWPQCFEMFLNHNDWPSFTEIWTGQGLAERKTRTNAIFRSPQRLRAYLINIETMNYSPMLKADSVPEDLHLIKRILFLHQISRW